MDRWRAAVIGFTLGFGGWLLVGAAHAEGIALFAAAATLGAIAAVSARWLVALAGLLVGGLASYPAALALGTIAYLGENWEITFVLVGACALVGFGLGWLLAQAIQASSTRRRANR